jgi:hypothetical protein
MFIPVAGSRIRIFLSRRIKKTLDPRSATKNLSIFNPKIVNMKNDPGCLSRTADTDFFTSRISDPGVKKAHDPGSATLIFSFFHFFPVVRILTKIMQKVPDPLRCLDF